MDKIIELKNREGSKNFLKKLSSTIPEKESKTYLVVASSGVIPEYDEDRQRFVNIIDGPNIYIGSEINENKVRFIDFIPGTGCLITFE
jgi:hypothetical protein